MFSTESSGMGATVCTAGRFLLVAPFTKLEDEAEEEEAESVAPAGHDRCTNLEPNKLNWINPSTSQIHATIIILNSSYVKIQLKTYIFTLLYISLQS